MNLSEFEQLLHDQYEALKVKVDDHLPPGQLKKVVHGMQAEMHGLFDRLDMEGIRDQLSEIGDAVAETVELVAKRQRGRGRKATDPAASDPAVDPAVDPAAPDPAASAATDQTDAPAGPALPPLEQLRADQAAVNAATGTVS